jgi:hypothetical protein
MEQTKQRPEEPRDPEVPLDYFIVATSLMEWYVSREIAAFIDECLEETPAPRWVTFVDLTGARVRVRARLLQYVAQCTVDQRALARAMQRAMNREAKADRDWDEE